MIPMVFIVFSPRASGEYIWGVTQLFHDGENPLPGFLADIGISVDDAGNGGNRYVSMFGNIIDIQKHHLRNCKYLHTQIIIHNYDKYYNP